MVVPHRAAAASLVPLASDVHAGPRLIDVPFAGGRVLYPSAWVGPFNASHLFGLDQLFPERRLFEATLAAARPGVVVDVGANIGVYALMTRGITRARIIAYEPSPLAYHVFKRMLDVDGMTDIDLRLRRVATRPAVPACRRESTAMSAASRPRTGASSTISITSAVRPGTDSRRLTPNRSRSTISWPARPDRADQDRLRRIRTSDSSGARRVLAEQRPTLFIELHPEMIRRAGDAPEDVCTLLADSFYDLECWNFQRTRRASLLPRLLGRYRAHHGHRYSDVNDMLADLPVGRPQQVYLVATPAIHARRSADKLPVRIVFITGGLEAGKDGVVTTPAGSRSNRSGKALPAAARVG